MLTMIVRCCQASIALFGQAGEVEPPSLHDFRQSFAEAALRSDGLIATV